MAMIRNGEIIRCVAKHYQMCPEWRPEFAEIKIDCGAEFFFSEEGAKYFADDLIRTAESADWPGPRGKNGSIPLIVDCFETDSPGQWCVTWEVRKE
jgi:hypothetical protein